MCDAKVMRQMSDDIIRDGLVIYQAQSPDENALVSASRSFQFAILVRSNCFTLIF